MKGKILIVDDEADLRAMLKSILAEADLLMAVNGYPTIEAIRASGAQKLR